MGIKQQITDPLGNKVILYRDTLYGHIYKRHPELNRKKNDILKTISEPDSIAKSKKDNKSILYFRRINELLILMVVASPAKKYFFVRTSFYVINTSKGDPIIWQKKTST